MGQEDIIEQSSPPGEDSLKLYGEPKAILIDLIYKMEQTCVNITGAVIEVLNDADAALGSEGRDILLPHISPNNDENWVDVLSKQRNLF